jgi:hypothetical protein
MTKQVKQIEDKKVADETETVVSGVESGKNTPVLVFDEKTKKYVFQTPDGRQFNTMLKAERHLKELKIKN